MAKDKEEKQAANSAHNRESGKVRTALTAAAEKEMREKATKKKEDKK